MNEWYHTVWGIILLGALGSVLGAVLLKITLIVLNKMGPRLMLRLFSNILMRYAENKYFVHKCEENGRPELIAVNYSMTMSKYTKTQILFVVTIAVCFVIWISYFTSEKLNIIIPILFSLFAIKDFYDFVVWYLATSGCLPDDMKQYGKEIKALKKEDRYQFIENAVMKNDS